MDRLEFIKYLISEVEEQQKINEIYTDAFKKAREEGKSTWECTKDLDIQNVAVIKDSLKMIRRLTLKIEKELHKEW